MKANIARYLAALALTIWWGFATDAGYGQTKMPLVKPVAAPPIQTQGARPLPGAMSPNTVSPQTLSPTTATPIQPISHLDSVTGEQQVPIVQASQQLAPVTSSPVATQPLVPVTNHPPQPPIIRGSFGPAPVVSPPTQGPGIPQRPEPKMPSVLVPSPPRIAVPQTHPPSVSAPSTVKPTVVGPTLDLQVSTRATESETPLSSAEIVLPPPSDARSIEPETATPPDYSFYLGRPADQNTEMGGQEQMSSIPLLSPNKLPTVKPVDNYLDTDPLPLENELLQMESRSHIPSRGAKYFQDSQAPVEPLAADSAIGPSMNPDQMGSLETSGQPCASCGGTGCSECGMLSGDWSDSVGNNYQDFDNRFDCCGFVPGASEYAILDVLYWTRNQGGIVGTNFGAVGGYDYEFGGRLTLGQRSDRIHGREFTYFGILPLEQERTQVAPGPNINARFLPADGFGNFETSAFFNAVETTQRAETQFHSVAFDRTRYGWDIVKTNIGLRYIYVDEKYSLASENFLGHQGLLGIAGRNHLFGGNIGLDMFYDVGQRVSFSWFGKLGGYLNANRTEVDLINRGTQFVANSDSSAQFAASIDLGVNAHYHINNNARFRIGYGGLWITGVTTAGANYPRFMTPDTGRSANDENDVFFHGLNIGLELFR